MVIKISRWNYKPPLEALFLQLWNIFFHLLTVLFSHILRHKWLSQTTARAKISRGQSILRPRALNTLPYNFLSVFLILFLSLSAPHPTTLLTQPIRLWQFRQQLPYILQLLSFLHRRQMRYDNISFHSMEDWLLMSNLPLELLNHQFINRLLSIYLVK